MLELHIQRTDRPSAPPTIKKFATPLTALTIGRAADNDLTLDDPSVSRHHCHLARTADGWTVEDLDSANGTLLGSEPIEGIHPLLAATEISIGVFRLTLAPPPVTTPKPRRPPLRTGAPLRSLATAALAITLAITGGWTSARIWDVPLRLPTARLDCPKDHPALDTFETALTRISAAQPEEATRHALTLLTRLPDLPAACNLHLRAEAALTAALARLDHQRVGSHPAPIRTILADTDVIASLDREGNLALWTPDHRSRPPLAPPPTPDAPAPDLLSLARNHDTLVAGTDDGRVLRWNLRTLELTAHTHGVRPISAVALTSTTLWSIDDVGTLRRQPLDAAHHHTTLTWPGVDTLTPLRDGRILVFGAGRAAVVTADLRRATALTTGAALRTIAVDDAAIIAGDTAGKVTRWRLARTLRPEPLTAHGGPVRAVAVHADLVASIGDDDALRLIELGRRVRRSGPPLVLLAEVPVLVDRLLIRADTLIGSGPEGALVTWDLSQRTRRLPATLHDAHPGNISALATTPSTAISGGDDGTLRAWPLTPPPADATTSLLTRACTALGWDTPGCEASNN